ncbi:hypothetical protein LGH83_04555 [Lichenihabitans sp. PAMC28606]|uniref:hypothetical protein n=1 Tax=Lichenihabitans sp. PAMC28606 TaxID=2880932 RepID=UPI001D0BC03E|nr:hypothetical protein [Lichenihabitans sp. PAMC28606]UDL95498.1 hypothetical protein LGH83_04555 [Lichenihabitans sp. PAMC28606]
MTDTVVDWTDPCARAAALTSAYYAILSGDREQRIRTRTLETETDVTFAASNVTVLRDEMIAAQNACDIANGQPDPRRRFAISAGSLTSRRRFF